MESQCVHGVKYEKLYGDLDKEETWDRLELWLDREFYFASGSSLLIARTCIDTAGHKTTECYKWLKKMEKKGKRISGIKGVQTLYDGFAISAVSVDREMAIPRPFINRGKPRNNNFFSAVNAKYMKKTPGKAKKKRRTGTVSRGVEL